MNTNEAKPTPGPVSMLKSPFCVVMGADGFPICDTHSIHRTLPEYQANARFIKDAFDVRHETGLTPRQLAEQRDELREALCECVTEPEAHCMKVGTSRFSRDLTWCMKRRIDAISNIARAALAETEGSTR